ncbi:hypothetical protein AB0D46_30950 [Streptomyces sp. NPDC048383]|uniref:hypothetical protein n=1 Tax=Streptomyces sp. NPDC048383 TaxID=3155386 RepID=UPI00342E4B69
MDTTVTRRARTATACKTHQINVATYPGTGSIGQDILQPYPALQSTSQSPVQYGPRAIPVPVQQHGDGEAGTVQHRQDPIRFIQRTLSRHANDLHQHTDARAGRRALKEETRIGYRPDTGLDSDAHPGEHIRHFTEARFAQVQ